MDDKVVEWIYKQNVKGVAVSGNMIGARARLLVNLYVRVLGLPPPPKEFQGSSGYVTNLKKRHNLVYCSMSGQKVSADKDAVAPFIDELKQIIEEGGYSLDQVYNVDETGLVWKQAATYTYAPNVMAKSKLLSTVKGSKSRVTLLLGGNATGTHKLKPLLINKSADPKGLKGKAAKDELPVYYRHVGCVLHTHCCDSTMSRLRHIYGLASRH